MGHYDSCRPGYCGGCGAGPGNLARNGGVCPFCHPKKPSAMVPKLQEPVPPKAVPRVHVPAYNPEKAFDPVGDGFTKEQIMEEVVRLQKEAFAAGFSSKTGKMLDLDFHQKRAETLVSDIGFMLDDYKS